jgi:ESS family glutamate:Na+ symporter
MKDFFAAAGLLLPFGFGQGTGQAMNYGGIYEAEFGFDGGRSFGLTIAALGFLSASIGGVIHLNILKHKKKFIPRNPEEEVLSLDEIKGNNEMPMEGSMDKVTMQMALIVLAYWVSHVLMEGLSQLIPGFRAVLYGFNFLLGVLAATVIRSLLNLCYNKKVIRHRYVNNFLMTRISNFFFDVMVVAGIAAIRLSVLEKYWGIMLILGVVGLVFTYFYNRFVARALFPEYSEQQFLMMYGMLTGTASTGVILLREMDGKFQTPAADNLVYQNFPAIALGFPMMLLATLAPVRPGLTFSIFCAYFVVLNVVLFRSKLFRKRKPKNDKQ